MCVMMSCVHRFHLLTTSQHCIKHTFSTAHIVCNCNTENWSLVSIELHQSVSYVQCRDIYFVIASVNPIHNLVDASWPIKSKSCYTLGAEWLDHHCLYSLSLLRESVVPLLQRSFSCGGLTGWRCECSLSLDPSLEYLNLCFIVVLFNNNLGNCSRGVI